MLRLFNAEVRVQFRKTDRYTGRDRDTQRERETERGTAAIQFLNP